jgi:AraC-like DNA-binding protein
LFLVLHGRLRTEVNGRTWEATDGELMVVPAQLPHQVHIVKDTREITVTYVPGDFAFDDSARLIEVGHDSLVEHLMKDIAQLWRANELHHEVTGALLVALLSYLNWMEKREAAARALHPGVATALQAIERDLAASLSIKHLAQEAHLSVGHLQALFRRQMGCSPLKYRQELRLQQACHLLEESRMPVQQIAKNCGFSDVEYFGRAFKHAYKTTPVRWRSRKRDRKLASPHHE